MKTFIELIGDITKKPVKIFEGDVEASTAFGGPVVKSAENSKTKPETKTKPEKTLEEYYNTLDPETGKRYAIPNVLPTDPDYIFKYAYYMKMKDNTPETFNSIINWE